MGTPPSFPTNFAKGNNFCDKEPLSKQDIVLKKKEKNLRIWEQILFQELTPNEVGAKSKNEALLLLKV